MGSNEGHAWVSLGGVDHVELSEGFFGLTDPSSTRGSFFCVILFFSFYYS